MQDMESTLFDFYNQNISCLKGIKRETAIKNFMYGFFICLSELHSIGVCHRFVFGTFRNFRNSRTAAAFCECVKVVKN